jgi:serine/threonine-protein kinase
MTLQPGARLGPYEIEAAAGAGGMGEVYRARDTRLDRTVAIKVLPEGLAVDPQFRERFDREARVISSLDHPHICTLHDVGQQDGTAYLVMQYLDGETLADRLSHAGRVPRAGIEAVASGPAAGSGLPVDAALQVAIQIASALDAAHRAGIVHRDLKPGNIMLTKAGAKLLDFGLAKVARPAVAVAGSMAPTTPPSMTVQGAILGTFQYMAPEQIEGVEADARTDIFAFGAVLFEMLTGRPAFEGKTRASLLGAILKDEPPRISARRTDAPPALDRIVATCLAKEADDRWQTARDLLRELKWAVEETTTAMATRTPQQTTAAAPRRWTRVAPWATAAVCGAALAVVVAVWAPWRPQPPVAPMRFAIVPPATQPLQPSPNDRQIAISPDGARLAYVASAAPGPLFVRAMDQLEAEPLRGITTARVPFFSPDGRWIGFFEGNQLKKVSVTGGPPITLSEIGEAPRGASWGSNDTIVFATLGPTTGLMSVPAGGGEPKVLTKPDVAAGEDHFFPSLLPGGRAVLFLISGAGIGAEDSRLAVLDLDTGQQKTLLRGAGSAEYVESGHLVYGIEGTLRAVRFDPARLEVLSDPVPVVEAVAIAGSGAANFSISRTGALVYVPFGFGGPAAVRSLVWVDRQGREEPIKGPPRAYFTLRLSPDATRAALDIRDQESDVWIWDFARQTLTRLTFDRSGDIFPVWTPDGARIVFRRDGGNAVLWRSADGTGTEERLRAGSGVPMSFAPDGRSLLLTDAGDIRLLPLDGKSEATPLVQTNFSEGLAEISSDGRWLAYQSNESGQNQVYVRPFPDVNSGRWQVSPAGGTHPAWARSGRELFYRDAAGALTTVPIQTTPAFRAGNPTRLFDTKYHSAVNMRSYDVTPDGRRFLMIKDLPATEQTKDTTPASIVVVLNWLEELKARVP